MRKLWRALFGRAERDRDLNEELQAHLEFEIDMRLRRGATQAEAERGARLALGNLTGVAEQTRAAWSFSWLTGLWQDLAFAWRLIQKSPVFTAAAVASLALGIGANTAIYAVFEKTLLEQVAVQAPEELYQLAYRTIDNKPGTYASSHPYLLMQEIADRSKTLNGVSCTASATPSYRSGNESRVLETELVCGNLFDLLGVRPALGRLLTTSDNLKPGAHPVVVLAHHFWKSEFGGDPGVLGRKMELNRQPFTIIGVAPANYLSLNRGNAPKVYLPVVMDGVLSGGRSETLDGGDYWLRLVARRNPGVRPEQIEAELTPIYRQFQRERTGVPLSGYQLKVVDSGQVLALEAGRGYDLDRRQALYSTPLMMLLATVGMVLLIACINIANLLLARAASRQREITTRLALGASRWRLIRQFLTESMMLAGLGGLAGLVLSMTLERVLMLEAFGKTALLSLSDWPAPNVLGVTLALTVFSGLVFGLVPAFTADRQGLRGGHRFIGRKLMVSFQVALSVLLLSGAALFLQTLENLRRIDAGFVRENLVVMRVNPLRDGRSAEALSAYYQNMERQLRQVPGVKGLALSSIGMMVGWQWGSGIQIEGVEIPEKERSPLRNAVGPDFFTVIGARLLEGRDFRESDNRTAAPKVAIVNESFARRYFGDASALGRRIGRGKRPGLADKPDYTIIGVVKDLRDSRISDASERYWYVPYAQQDRLDGMSIHARTWGDSTAMIATLRNSIGQIDPYAPVSQEGTMEMAVEAQIRQERLVARLSAFFAGVALLLAVVGLYGVMAYTVERRTKEIGIRMALGESRSQVLWMFLRETSLFVALGIAAGVPLALAMGSYAGKLLYGVKPADWLSITIAVTTISAFGLLAGLLSARRAATIEPLAALRIE